MRRPPYLLIITVVVGLVLAACASPAASGEPGASSGSEPSAAPGASQGGGGGGGGLTLSDGLWSAGAVHVVVSGDANLTFDGDLVPSNSISDAGNTFLTYLAGDGQGSVSVAIYPDSVAISVTHAEFVGGGGSTEGQQCDASFTQGDDSGIDGTVRCTDAPGFAQGGVTGITVDIQASFTATR